MYIGRVTKKLPIAHSHVEKRSSKIGSKKIYLLGNSLQVPCNYLDLVNPFPRQRNNIYLQYDDGKWHRRRVRVRARQTAHDF